ncbi:MAG: type II toxin-antitoxin system RelE/ParE family toxin [Rhodoplanes sp.]
MVDSSCRYQGHSRVHCPGQSSRGSRVVRRIEKAIDRLRILPLSGRPGVVKGTRILVVPGLPYVAIYRVVDDFVDIVAVLHTARRRRSER